MTKENAYKLLELSTTCKDEKEITKAFKKLAMKHHPDRGGSEENFKKLLMAKEVLLKPTVASINGKEYTQEQYDQALREYVRRMREDLNKMETAVRGTPRQRKTSKIRTVLCGLYLGKWIILMALGLSTPWLSLISLGVFGLLFLTAPVMADLHDDYLKLKSK